MAHSVLLLGASGARGRGGGVGCRCWVGLLIRCRCCRRWGRCGWVVAAGAVAGVRLMALMVSNIRTDDRELRWMWRCRFVEGCTSAWCAIDGCGRRWCGVADCSVELMCRSSWWRAAADACLGRRRWRGAAAEESTKTVTMSWSRFFFFLQ